MTLGCCLFRAECSLPPAPFVFPVAPLTTLTTAPASASLRDVPACSCGPGFAGNLGEGARSFVAMPGLEDATRNPRRVRTHRRQHDAVCRSLPGSAVPAAAVPSWLCATGKRGQTSSTTRCGAYSDDLKESVRSPIGFVAGRVMVRPIPGFASGMRLDLRVDGEKRVSNQRDSH
jgi:hypothetical protein